MATLSAVAAPQETVTRLSATLEAGVEYMVQNIGIYDVEYCNYATDPSEESVGWRICKPADFFATGPIDNDANALWVRGRTGDTSLSVGVLPS